MDPAQIVAQAGELRVGGEALQRRVEIVQPGGSVQLGGIAAVERLEDAAFGVAGEALVYPEIVRARVGDEVAGPGVRELVRDHVYERTVAGEERRRDEGQPRVLHTPLRKARRH